MFKVKVFEHVFEILLETEFKFIVFRSACTRILAIQMVFFTQISNSPTEY